MIIKSHYLITYNSAHSAPTKKIYVRYNSRLQNIARVNVNVRYAVVYRVNPPLRNQ